MDNLAELLKGGDRRSIGRSDVVVELVIRMPERFAELWNCLRNGNPLVRMRAADALEKISRDHVLLFKDKKKELLSGVIEDGTPELRWHLIAIMARLSLTSSEADKLIHFLDHCLRHDQSRIVRVMALQAAYDIGAELDEFANRLKNMLAWARSSSLPSVRARARKLAGD